MVECPVAVVAVVAVAVAFVARKDLGRLLSAAAEAWCVPAAHGTCRLPEAVLQGSGAAASSRLGHPRRRHGGEEDYEGLSSLISLVRSMYCRLYLA